MKHNDYDKRVADIVATFEPANDSYPQENADSALSNRKFISATIAIIVVATLIIAAIWLQLQPAQPISMSFDF
jgi:hypothetical protein